MATSDNGKKSTPAKGSSAKKLAETEAGEPKKAQPKATQKATQKPKSLPNPESKAKQETKAKPKAESNAKPEPKAKQTPKVKTEQVVAPEILEELGFETALEPHEISIEVNLDEVSQPEHAAPEGLPNHTGSHALTADDSGHAATHHQGHNNHHAQVFKKQFLIALALTVPTLIWSSMTQDVLNFTAPEFPGSNLVSAVLGTILLFTCGRVFLTSGFKEIKARRPGMMALLAMALTVAFGYSAFLTVAQLAGLGFSGMDFWWELSALVTIMLLGHWLEMSSISRAKDAMGDLANLLPDFAIIKEKRVERRVPVSELKVGQMLVVRPGSVIPADGFVIAGHSFVNESMITGEFNPVEKHQDDHVFAGSINAVGMELGLGEIAVRITAVGDSSVVGTIGKLVSQAQASKSKTQLLADKAAGWLFYASLFAAFLTALLWPLVGHAQPSFVLERVVTVLVIACPHALGLAVPLVSSITTAKAARNGILIRDRIAFESVRKVDVVLFDKTGTLTTGNRGVIGSHITRRGALEDLDELIAVAAGLEQGSEHPIGRAILAEAAKRKIKPLDIKDIMTTPGVGVSGRFDEYRLFAGGPALLTKNRIDIEVQDLMAADAANSAGQTVIYIVRDTVLLGFVTLGDQLRETSQDAVYDLQRMGKRVAMLTGDAHGVANAVAAQLGIDEVYAEVLPHQKAEVVANLQAGGATVAVVGDGVNDAPALAQANVGIAIGSGTNVAVESAGVVLISDDPMSVLSAITLARKSYSKMVQNLLWGAGYNLIAIPLAAGAFAGLTLTPAVGAVLMSLSTIIVAANAQLLRRDS